MRRQRVSATALAAFLVMLWGCNIIQYQRGRIRGHLADAGFRETQVRLGDDTISYWDGGIGSPVVFLHGMGMAGLWQWNEQATAFVHTHRVIIPEIKRAVLLTGAPESGARRRGVMRSPPAHQ